jgi:tetratricopeptide (TPR) repeat protein
MKNLRRLIVLIFVLHALPSFAQKNKAKNDSLAIRDSIRDYMFHGALLSMDALQAKYESQRSTDLAEKQQKAGEAQNLFFQSRAAYRKAIAYDKHYYPAWTNMGTAYYLQDLPKAAIPCYRQAILINPDYASAWFNLGKAYVMLNRNDSADYSFRQCIRSDSTSIQAYQELSRLVMAQKKDSAEAMKLLRLSAYYKPTSEVPWVSMSAVYFSYNDSANGMIYLEKAAKIYPGDVDRLRKLMNYYGAHGDAKKSGYYANLLAVEIKKQEIPADEHPDEK